MHRAHFACLALVGLAVMLWLRGSVLPTWATVILLPSVCAGTMLLGMRALNRDAGSSERASDADEATA